MKRVILIPVLLILFVGMGCSLGQSMHRSAESIIPTETLEVQFEQPTDAGTAEEILPTEDLQPTEAAAPSDLPEPTQAEPTAAAEATATGLPPAAAPTKPSGKTSSPTSTPAGPTSGEYFAEKFAGNIADFTRWVTVGDPKKHFGTLVDSMLRFELPAMDTYAYATRNGYAYADVYVEAKGNVVNGTNDSLAVVCRVSDAGWDEFRISARGIFAGTYEVYRYDQSLADKHQIPYVNLLINTDRINSMDIKAGIQKNTIGMACVGQELRIFINGIEQTKHNKKLEDKVLTSGGVGVGVIGYNNTGSIVQFESLETKKPE